MTSGIERRLRKLEAESPRRKPRLFVIEGGTPAAREACIAKLIHSGKARATDTFVHTGVTRSY